MKLKKTIVAASLIGLMSAYAQESVTLGVFGYTQVEKSEGFGMQGMPFINSTNNTPSTLYSTNLPLNSVIYAWDGTTYSSAIFSEETIPRVGTVIRWSADIDLPHGTGYWIETPSAATNILSGEVPMADSITNSISMGLQICSYPYPVDRVITNLGFSPSLGDVIYIWNGSEYLSSIYDEVTIPRVGTVVKWSDEVIPLAIGQGFWYQSEVDTQWIVSRPYPGE